MAKTKIEWCDYSINPVKGLCPMACSYCYARRMYKRFKWNPEIRYDEDADLSREVGHRKFPPNSKVFVGSTMELFGSWIKDKWLSEIFYDCWSRYLDVTFLFLTKQPQNLSKWSPFPDNCWVGVTATDIKMYDLALFYLNNIRAKVKYISLEPLLGSVKPDVLDAMPHILNWVIIGQQTPVKSSTRPKPEWIQEIIDATDKAGIPVFVKNNILNDKNLHWVGNWNRQEFPIQA